MAKEILIADPDKADQEEFQKIFEATDYHLTFSESGDDALLRAKLFKPDMIIAPGAGLLKMGGLELCSTIKTDQELKHIPFIIISSMLGEISEKDRQRVLADGMISKPLNEDEILNLVDQLMEEGTIGKREKKMPEKQEEFLLEGIGEEEEEIIELVDVVEEPEPRMSIDNFVTSEKEEPFGELTPLESWGKPEFEGKPSEKKLVPTPERKMGEKDLQMRREMPPKEAIPEEELFEKIELEEILEKVEQLKPSLEKEWPSEKEVRDIETKPFQMEESAEKYLDLSEFEASLQKEVKPALPEEELQPIFIEEPKGKILEEAIPIEESVEEEELKELPEEEFPDELLEEILGEDEISAIEEQKEFKPEAVRLKEGMAEEVKVDRLEEVEVPKVSFEKIPPPAREVDKQMQEVISKRVQEMMEEIVTKFVPEMTQNVVSLTIERIEKMVKEVVPDLAEKAIQEEIKRLQKGEKE
jgi:twitching motility two-component system response regulator PilH